MIFEEAWKIQEAQTTHHQWMFGSKSKAKGLSGDRLLDPCDSSLHHVHAHSHHAQSRLVPDHFDVEGANTVSSTTQLLERCCDDWKTTSNHHRTNTLVHPQSTCQQSKEHSALCPPQTLSWKKCNQWIHTTLAENPSKILVVHFANADFAVLVATHEVIHVLE